MLILIGESVLKPRTRPGAYGVFGLHLRASLCTLAIWQGSFVWREHHDARFKSYLHVLRPG